MKKMSEILKEDILEGKMKELDADLEEALRYINKAFSLVQPAYKATKDSNLWKAYTSLAAAVSGITKARK